MPPHDGLVHPKEYRVEDSNVELIGSDIDHKLKHASAASEPAWNNGVIGKQPGLFVWRIEDFEVIPWPQDRAGTFFDGDSFIVLHSIKVGKDEPKLAHEIFFWLGAQTSQDEAGVAAYKTVELDEFLDGKAVQHRETQREMSDQFVSLFKRLEIRKGGVKSGFAHVDTTKAKPNVTTLLRVFKHPGAGRADSILVHEVAPAWQSLDEGDVFILDKGDKIWVWQGKKCSPMEKAKAAQVVHDMTTAKHVDVEVVSQTESRSRHVVSLLGGPAQTPSSFEAERPTGSRAEYEALSKSEAPKKLYRLSDASGALTFDLVKEATTLRRTDLESSDVFLIDTGKVILVWEGQQASRAERAMWLKVTQAYSRQLGETSLAVATPSRPIAKVVEGNESAAFFRAIEVS